jgi:tripartite-type tricarboxylate transporter receptor subunit TctC
MNPRTLGSSLKVIGFATLVLTALNAGSVRAQDAWTPQRPIRLIAPSPPGGGTDTVSRVIAAKLEQMAKWQIVVETKPGAGNNIGMDAGAKSAPDGYTLVMGETSNLAVNQFLYKKLSFDPAKDLTPVALIGTGALVLVVPAASDYDSLQSLLAAAQGKQISYASSGNGTVGHLVAESLRVANSAELLHVPYKGAGPAMTDLLGGQVDMYFASLTSALPLIKAGKLRALAVTSGSRLPVLPNVPTLAESGMPGSEYYVFYGVVVPSRTPMNIVTTLNREINAALDTPDVRSNLHEKGIEVQPSTPGQFAAFLESERRKWAPIIRASGASVD